MLGRDFIFQSKLSESKYLSVFLLTILLIGGAFSGIWFTSKSQESSLKADLSVKVAFLKDAIVDRSKVNILLGDTSGLAEIYKEVRLSSDNLIDISFYDAQKRQLWAHPQSSNELFLSEELLNQISVAENKLTINFEVSDNSNERLGYLHFICSTQEIDTVVRLLQLRVGGIASVLIITLFLITIWSTNRVNRINRSQSLSMARIELAERNNKQLGVENEILERVLGQNDLYGIGSDIVSTIAKFLGTDNAILYAMVDNELIQVASLSEILKENQLTKNPIKLTFGVGTSGTVAKTRKALFVNHESKVPEYMAADAAQRSEIAVPIIFGDELIGVISSEHPDKSHFTTNHLDFLIRISNLIALGLKNSIVELEIKEKNIVLKKLEKLREKLIKDLTESNDELSNYAHVVSHDLKTPLRSISAALAWLKEDNQDKLDEMSLSYLSIVEDALVKMDRIISDTLKYSELRQQSSNVERVDLTEVLDHMLRELSQSYPDTSIEVDGKMPILFMNEIKLIHIFQNILDNACKYRDPDKTSRVKVHCSVKSEFFEFSIQDNGIGIPEESAHHVFEIFQKLNNNNDNSNGIGMSIVKKIVESYGGKIWFESQEGKGTTFKFNLPRSFEDKSSNFEG